MAASALRLTIFDLAPKAETSCFLCRVTREEPNVQLTCKDVWEVGVKMGWANGSYNPRTNGMAARAEVMASLLNEVIAQHENWLPALIESEDAMRAWEANTPREKVLRLYKFLNQPESSFGHRAL